MRCKARGASNAPGTPATAMEVSATPESARALSALRNRRSPISALNLDTTTPTRMCSARVLDAIRRTAIESVAGNFGGCVGFAGESIPPRRAVLRRVFVAQNLEPEACHARHLPRPRQQAHLADVEVAQYLRPDAVVSQIHARLGRRLIGTGPIAQFLRRLGSVQQHQHSVSCAGDRG